MPSGPTAQHSSVQSQLARKCWSWKIMARTVLSPHSTEGQTETQRWKESCLITHRWKQECQEQNQGLGSGDKFIIKFKSKALFTPWLPFFISTIWNARESGGSNCGVQWRPQQERGSEGSIYEESSKVKLAAVEKALGALKAWWVPGQPKPGTAGLQSYQICLLG